MLEIVLDGIGHERGPVRKINRRASRITLQRSKRTHKLQDQWFAAKNPVSPAQLEPVSLSVLRRIMHARLVAAPKIIGGANATWRFLGLVNWQTGGRRRCQPGHARSQNQCLRR